MSQVAITSISADQLFNQGYKLPELSIFNNRIRPMLERVEDAKTHPMENIFKTSEDTFNFYSDLKALWFLAVSNLAEGLLSRKIGTGIAEISNCEKYSLKDIFIMLVKDGVHLEPTTKFFLEEMFNVLFRNRQGNLSRYYYILSKPIRDYNIGRQGLELRLDKVHPLFKKSDSSVPRFEFNTALQQLGLPGTIDAIRIMFAICINLMYLNNKGLLNSTVTPVTNWKTNMGVDKALKDALAD